MTMVIRASCVAGSCDASARSNDVSSRRPDPARILQRPRSRRMGRPFGMAEIGVVRAGRDHEPVVGNDAAVMRGGRLRAGRIHGRDLAEDDVDIVVPAENAPDRTRDVGGRQRRRRDLVEQRHEQVVVPPVDDRDPDRRAAQFPGAGKPAEPRADE